MRHRHPLPALLAILALALAACTGELTFPTATIETVTPSEVTTAGGDITIEGTNFFQYEDGERTRIEACGVSVPGDIVAPTVQTILLPPGDRVRVEAGTTLTANLPTEGLEPGVSDLRIVRPDGTSTVLENAVICIAPDSDPDAEPEPTLVDAVITTSTTRGPAPLTISFDASDSTGEGDLTYAWSFGDGATATTAAPSHAYETPGTYTITLTVTDETGENDTATTTITVTDGSPTARATIHLEPTWPEGEEGTGPAPEYVVTFDGTASTDPNGDDLTYAWSTGGETVMNGDVVEVPEPTPANIEFAVTLTVTDPAGNSDAVTLYTVLDPYADDFFGRFDPGFPEEPPLGLRLTPQQTTEETAPDAEPDVMRLTWYDAEEGGVNLEIETAEEHTLLDPGDAMACEPPEVRLRAQQVTPSILIADVFLSTDGDFSAGGEAPLGFPRPEYGLTLAARNADGSFPIVEASENPACESDPVAAAHVTQEGSLLTFRLPEEVVAEATLLFPGIIVGLADSLEATESTPTDSLPDMTFF